MYDQNAITFFAALLILLTVGDMLLTIEALKYPGTSEANPILRKLMEKFGVTPPLVVFKGLQILAILWYAFYYPVAGAWLLAIICIPFVYVVYRNYMVIQSRKARGFKKNGKRNN